MLTAGNVSDVKAAPALIERAGGMRYLLADKGYDADRLRRSLRDAGTSRPRRIASTTATPPARATSRCDQTTSPRWTTPAGWCFRPGPV